MDSRPEPYSEEEPFETHCIVEISPKCSEEIARWLVERIRSSKASGGAELHVQIVRHVDSNQCSFLHVSAPSYRLMEIAEWLEIMKPDPSDHNAMKEFTVASMSRFLPDGRDPRLFFTNAEKARFAEYELYELRAKAEEMDRFQSSNKLRFNEGQSLVTKLLRREFIVQMFPLHDKEELKRLASDWIKLKVSKTQPLDDVKNYFGEQIAIYFAFLGFYTDMLFPATILGVTMFLVQFFSEASLSTTAAFAAFNLFWATFFFERWKRYCNRLCYKWGVLYKSYEELELPRAEFKGTMGKNPVTGMAEPVYSELTRNIWIGFVSTPIVVLCLVLTLLMLQTYLHTQLRLTGEYLKNPTLWLFFGRFVPTAGYTVCINVLKIVYKYVATWLTDKENHRLQTSYEFHMIWKLLLFNFVNSFASLFYISFWIQDLALLRSHLAAQLVTNQIIDQFPETIIPFFKVKYEKWRMQKELRKETTKRESRGENEDPNFIALREQGAIESDLPVYLGTFDDYLELFLQKKGGSEAASEPGKLSEFSTTVLFFFFTSVVKNRLPPTLQLNVVLWSFPLIWDGRLHQDADALCEEHFWVNRTIPQFGYAFLFSSAFPIASFFALLNNYVEIRGDAFKLCNVMQRPFARRANSIGPWQLAFELMGFAAVVTNLSLIYVTPNMKDYFHDTDKDNLMLLFVAIEHLLIFAKLGMSVVLPTVPREVQLDMARCEYEMKQALKQRRAMESRKTIVEQRRHTTTHVRDTKMPPSLQSQRKFLVQSD